MQILFELIKHFDSLGYAKLNVNSSDFSIENRIENRFIEIKNFDSFNSY